MKRVIEKPCSNANSGNHSDVTNNGTIRHKTAVMKYEIAHVMIVMMHTIIETDVARASRSPCCLLAPLVLH
jgi:hypothetical protein